MSQRDEGQEARLQTRILFAVAVGLGIYLVLPAISGHIGFPLDDAWIHQTYARNLWQTGQWQYVPGVVSSGSTAPLWTILLAIGYALRLPYLLWAYVLGALSLFLLGVGGARLWRALWPGQGQSSWVVGIILVLTWQLLFAAASGMETALFIALALHLIAAYCHWRRDPVPSPSTPIWMGLISGLFILTRPEGLGLVLLIGVGMALRPQPWQERWRILLVGGSAAALTLVPYFAFNLASSGGIWPNTFYAKQAEYAALLTTPLPQRFFQLVFFSLGGPETGWRGISGAHLLLLPGLFTIVVQVIRSDWRQRRLLYTLPLLWALGHVLLYALRLPVTYQRGRYLWPVLPIWIIYGLAGWHIILQTSFVQRFGFLGRQFVQLTFVMMLIAFLGLGAIAYQSDVAFIEKEMVQVAQWLQENTAPDDLIAAHDIGAIGYFAPRPLLDLAGLISPEVVPYLDDPTAMADYVRQSNAVYLITAPGWAYTSLTSNTTPLFTTNYDWTVEQGLNNMAVYPLSEK